VECDAAACSSSSRRDPRYPLAFRRARAARQAPRPGPFLANDRVPFLGSDFKKAAKAQAQAPSVILRIPSF
jgi:hypothetical protein